MILGLTAVVVVETGEPGYHAGAGGRPAPTFRRNAEAIVGVTVAVVLYGGVVRALVARHHEPVQSALKTDRTKP